MERILVVEDDITLSAGLCFELDLAGFMTVAAYNCAKAQKLLDTDGFQLAILDVNLPDGNGYELCKSIKAAWPELPVIFLTANDMDEDVLAGYDLGADDYITKPFNTQILLRRIEIALKRNGAPNSRTYSDNYLTLDFNSLSAIRMGEKIPITPNEYKLLKILIANAGNIVTRQTLLEKLWDCDENYIDDHTLTVSVNRLRTKIEDKAHTYIKTIRGMGYIWIGGKL